MDKKRWVTALVAVVSLAVIYGLFNFNQTHRFGDEYYLINIAALFWLPMLLIFLVFREDPSNFGFATGDLKRGYREAAILFVIVLPLFFIAARMPDFQRYYPIDKSALLSIQDFIRFELVFGVYMFCWEFFFRGFMLFGLQRVIGSVGSVLVQAVAFGIMHIGKERPEVIASFGAGIILGILALRAKSFFPCFILHWVCSFTFDILVIMGIHKMLF